MTANNALPKAELHVHLEGTISPELAQKLAKRNNLPLPDGLFNAKGDYNWADFTQFLNSYDAASSVIRTKQDYSDITYEYLASIAKEGALYAELGIAPDITRDIIGLEYDELLQGLEDGVNRARAEFGIDARMIATAVRHLGPKKATEMAKLVAANPHPLVTGFGLAGDERMHSPADFAEAFQIAHKAGLGCTAHAGEFGGPESVRDTIEALPVSRIGHGVRAAEDAELLQDLADRGITLEVCPNSNIALKVFDSFESHSFPALYEAGIVGSLNSDDPPFFWTSLGQEYDTVKEYYGLDDDQLLDITRKAITTSFAEPELKVKLLKRIDAYQAQQEGQEKAPSAARG